MNSILKFSIVLLFITTVLSSPAVLGDSQDLTFKKSVVMIRVVKQDHDYRTPWKQSSMSSGIGSGFVIEGGLILTNAHNISNAKYVEVRKQGLAKRYIARVAFAGHDCDLAVLAIDDMSFYNDVTQLELGGIPAVNSTVQTYGFPMGGRQISVTEGVVSRIEMDIYAHPRADSHLVVQTDAAINPGNSGGPVIQDGKVVGVAFQGLSSGDNIGYMIPTTVIRHFIEDIKDGKYDGFGSLGFSIFPGLHSDSYRDYLQVPEGAEGVVVLQTMMHSSVENLLKPEDVITSIGGYKIDNDGNIEIYGLRINMAEAIERKQIGENIDIEFFRDGKLQKITAEVALNKPIMAYWREYDQQPRFKVFAGLTFVTVSRNFLETWGSSWTSDIPFYLRYLFVNLSELNESRDRKEYVVLSEILADEVNAYAYGYENKVVESVNCKTINSLDDLMEAFDNNKDDFCTIKFMSSPIPLILDNSKALERNDDILNRYKVPLN